MKEETKQQSASKKNPSKKPTTLVIILIAFFLYTFLLGGAAFYITKRARDNKCESDIESARAECTDNGNKIVTIPIDSGDFSEDPFQQSDICASKWFTDLETGLGTMVFRIESDEKSACSKLYRYFINDNEEVKKELFYDLGDDSQSYDFEKTTFPLLYKDHNFYLINSIRILQLDSKGRIAETLAVASMRENFISGYIDQENLYYSTVFLNSLEVPVDLSFSINKLDLQTKVPEVVWSKKLQEEYAYDLPELFLLGKDDHENFLTAIYLEQPDGYFVWYYNVDTENNDLNYLYTYERDYYLNMMDRYSIDQEFSF